MAVASYPQPDPHLMRLVSNSSLSFTTNTTTTTKSTKNTKATAIKSPSHPISILITPAPQTPSPAGNPRAPSNFIRKRLSPGLQARLQRFEGQDRGDKTSRSRRYSIGRIPEEQLAEIESLQQQERETRGSIISSGRTKPWTSSASSKSTMPTSGGVRLSGGPVWTDNEVSVAESGDDFSSVIDISEDLAGETTEDDEALYLDKHKYRIPSPGKTRLNFLTKEPLSPPRRPTVGMQPSSPATANTSNPPPTSPPRMNSDHPSHWRNSSIDTVSDGDWVGAGVSRAGSIYSLSRVSFTGQLSQLTSMRLPDADSLSKRILSMASAAEAARALSDASEQIRSWISKASEVLGKLDAEDDVEWAAAGGQEGIVDVDEAIKRFEQLVQVYILAIERLQTRHDITQLPHADLLNVVQQMETIVANWQKIKDTLKGVKDQTEIAIEWMRLWNSVLGEIGQEMDALNELVFEMEEKRHSSAETLLTSRDSIAIDELETIVEDRPGRRKLLSATNGNRLSIPTASPNSPLQAPVDREDTSLLALFARMQPLRASLDFIPMRLSSFEARGGQTFPTACQDLEQRRERLEAQWMKLDADADSLRRELGEDKWVLVFRNAGRQALQMCDSIARSYSKLRDAVDSGEHQTDIPSIAKKVENYEAKKKHYGPAIERFFAIIDRGVEDRLTVNGEILRLQSEMRKRWASCQVEMREVDHLVEQLTHHTRDKELRDSVSTVVSSERSFAGSLIETPGTSPASSVISTSRRNSINRSRTPTALMNVKVRSGSNTTTNSSKTATARLSSSSIPRRSLLPRASIGSDRLPSSVTSSPVSTHHTPSKTVPAWPASSRPELIVTNRPRWSSAVKPDSKDHRPLASSEPSPYAKSPATPKSTFLRSTPKPSTTTTTTTTSLSTSAHPPSRSSVTSPSSLPRPSASYNTSPLQNRHVSLPASTLFPSGSSSLHSVYTPSKSLSSRSSNPILRPGSRLSSGGGGGGNRRPRIFRDGNDADTEAPSHHQHPEKFSGSGGGQGGGGSSRRPPSVMGGSGRGNGEGKGKRSSSLFCSSRLKFGHGHGHGKGGEEEVPALPNGGLHPGIGADGKPRWRV